MCSHGLTQGDSGCYCICYGGILYRITIGFSGDIRYVYQSGRTDVGSSFWRHPSRRRSFPTIPSSSGFDSRKLDRNENRKKKKSRCGKKHTELRTTYSSTKTADTRRGSLGQCSTRHHVMNVNSVFLKESPPPLFLSLCPFPRSSLSLCIREIGRDCYLHGTRRDTTPPSGSKQPFPYCNSSEMRSLKYDALTAAASGMEWLPKRPLRTIFASSVLACSFSEDVCSETAAKKERFFLINQHAHIVFPFGRPEVHATLLLVCETTTLCGRDFRLFLPLSLLRLATFRPKLAPRLLLLSPRIN